MLWQLNNLYSFKSTIFKFLALSERLKVWGKGIKGVPVGPKPFFYFIEVLYLAEDFIKYSAKQTLAVN